MLGYPSNYAIILTAILHVMGKIRVKSLNTVTLKSFGTAGNAEAYEVIYIGRVAVAAKGNPGRVFGRASGIGSTIPVPAPFPYIAAHIIKTQQ